MNWIKKTPEQIEKLIELHTANIFAVESGDKFVVFDDLIDDELVKIGKEYFRKSTLLYMYDKIRYYDLFTFMKITDVNCNEYITKQKKYIESLKNELNK